MRVLATAPDRPDGLMEAIHGLLAEKSSANICRLYDMIKAHKDWVQGHEFSWPSQFIHDVENVWMRGDDTVENI